MRLAIALTLAVGLLTAPFAAADASAARPPKAEYIVQMEDGYSIAYGRALVARLHGQVTTPELPVLNGFGALLGERAAKELSSRAGVKDVTANTNLDEGSGGSSGSSRCPGPRIAKRPVRRRYAKSREEDPRKAILRLNQSLQATIGADKAWLRGVTGDGVGVAVVDTGVAGYLPDFAGDGGSRVTASVVTNPCATDADDHVGHGTHVAGLIAGNSLGSGGPSVAGHYMGVAPRANLVSVKVSDDRGDTTILDVIYGLQFVVDHKDELGIRVVNLSLASSEAESYRSDPLDAAAEAAWFAGVVVVAAAGNDGSGEDAVRFAPGNDPYVITAGALDDRGTSALDDDGLPSWSSRGTTQDGFAKPDVLAPGTRLVAPLAPDSSFPALCAQCQVGRSYFRLSGTSMSTAVVSGTVALMLERRPGLTPDQVKGALVASARDVPGAGRAVDANAALDASGTANAGLVPSSLIDAATGRIDWARASFRRASFRDAGGSALGATWARASFRCDCGLDESGEVDQERVSFRRISFRSGFRFAPLEAAVVRNEP